MSAPEAKTRPVYRIVHTAPKKQETDTEEALLETLNEGGERSPSAQERNPQSRRWWPFSRSKKADTAAEEHEAPAEELSQNARELAERRDKVFKEGARSQGNALRMGAILPAFVALILIGITRVVFAMILAGKRSPKEVSSLMEMDRALGWLMSPLAALVTALGAIHIQAGGARRGFVIIGCVLAVWLLAAPLALTQYISPLHTSDLEAAGKRAGARLWHRRAASELAVVLLGFGGMMLFWWRRNNSPSADAAPAGPPSE